MRWVAVGAEPFLRPMRRGLREDLVVAGVQTAHRRIQDGLGETGHQDKVMREAPVRPQVAKREAVEVEPVALACRELGKLGAMEEKELHPAFLEHKSSMREAGAAEGWPSKARGGPAVGETADCITLPLPPRQARQTVEVGGAGGMAGGMPLQGGQMAEQAL